MEIPCKKIGPDPNCQFVAKGDDPAMIKKDLSGHIAKAHKVEGNDRVNIEKKIQDEIDMQKGERQM